jgi:hypothetical protein
MTRINAEKSNLPLISTDTTDPIKSKISKHSQGERFNLDFQFWQLQIMAILAILLSPWDAVADLGIHDLSHQLPQIAQQEWFSQERDVLPGHGTFA